MSKKRKKSKVSVLAGKITKGLKRGDKIIYLDSIGRKRGEGTFVEYRDYGFSGIIKDDKTKKDKFFFATQIKKKV